MPKLLDAFLHAGTVEPPALSHLIIGLRSLALHLKRRFWLRLGTKNQALHWSGEDFEVVEWSSSFATLRVEHPPRRGLQRFSSHAKLNAELLKLLVDRAFASPVLLQVDGLRIDSLLQRPGVPILFGCLEGDWPVWTVPRHTTEGLSRSHHWVSFQGTEFPESVPLAFLLSASPVGKTGPSRCNWLRDGVLVDQEELLESNHRASLDFFVSAEGLESDASGFALLESELRDQRRDSAARALLKPLKAASVDPTPTAKLTTRAKVGLSVVGGLLAMNPVMLLVVGGWALPVGILVVKDGFEKAAVVERCRRGLKELQGAWSQQFGGKTP